MEFLSVFEGIPSIAYLLFGIGVVLLLLEFCIPGISVAGIGAAIVYLIAIIIAADTLTEGIILAAIVLAISAVLFAAFFALLSRGKLQSRMILTSSTSREDGFTSAAEDLSHLVGTTGKAETTLRPAGLAVISGRTYDVVTSGNFIQAGTPIRVLEVTGSRIVVVVEREND